MPNINMKIKCSNCTFTDPMSIKCVNKTLIKTDIELDGKGYRISFPFNISCHAKDKNNFKISDISANPGITNMWISWTSPSANIVYYLVIVMDSTGIYSRNIFRDTFYQINNMKEKTWYQICIATIDKGITSIFQCNMALTDFSITGPVTNVTTTSESEKIFLSWSPPEYKHDIPEGYIIYLRGGINQMCRLYIINSQSDRHPASKYSCEHTQTLVGPLSRLEIKDLPPNSEFRIEISPFNRNKESAIKYLTIKTKEGESGPVGNLKTDLRKHAEYLYIEFDKPVNPAGEILKYRIRIILKRINICSTSNDMIHEDITEETHKYISKAVLQKKCGSYVAEVAPINRWNSNNGVGKNASVPFVYTMDSQSSLTTDAKFISSNSMTVSIGNMMKDKCENFGFIIGIMDEKNNSNCLTRIISRLDCEEFTREIEKHQKCGLKQIVKNYNLSSSHESFISGIFLLGHKYRWTVSMVADEITQVASASIENGRNKDCFTDCYNNGGFYRGIRSALKNGQICTNWKDSKTYSNSRGVMSNICSSVKASRPWCPDGDSWNYCDVPKCSSINSGTGCVDNISKDEEVQSVTIRWSLLKNFVSVLGYIIILHNSDHFCEQANIQLCNNCVTMDALGSQIKSVYLSCKSRDEISPIKYEASFRGLHQNRNYNVYITPIMSVTRIGEIMNATVHTKLAKPHIPSDVRYELDVLNKIKFVWAKNIENVTYGPSDRYMAYISNKKTGKTVSQTLNAESITFSNLEICTEYCFILLSSNRAGESDFSREICTFTLAPKPERVELEDPPSGYMTSVLISWAYSGSDNCPKSYLVEYEAKFQQQKPFFITTNKTSIQLTGLKPNFNYTVRVRAEAQLKTANEKDGEMSLSKEFYTGKLQPNLSYYNQNLDDTGKTLNISWGIDEEMQGSFFVYIIQVKNSTKDCIYSVHLTCTECKEPWIWNNVKDHHEEALKRLTNCTTNRKETMLADQISFNYFLKSDKEYSNFTVEVHGINLMGIHILNQKKTITPTQRKSYSVLIGLIVAIIIVFILIFVILVFIKLKKKPYSKIVKKNDMKIGESHFMAKIKKSESIKENIPSRESNGELVPTKQNKRLSDTDVLPKINSRKLNNKILISAFPAYYEEVSKNGNAELIKQYKKITNEAKSQEDSLELTVDVGKNSENSKKNRFVNILPFDQTRVKVGKKGPPHDYINANYIPFANDETQIEYIAAQGPIEGSLSDFWDMIWEQNIDCIVMLTRTMEDNKFKCLQYWPNDVEECNSYGSQNQFNVCLVKEEVKASHIERELSVKNTEHKEHRKIIQLHMHTWSDHSAPNLNFFDKLLFRFHEITNEKASNPYLVHCSAGVGRTGTLICIDRIIKELIGGLQEIRIYDTVLELRKYRSFMVQRQAQYIFIHDYINHFLAKYLKIEGVEDNIYFNDD